MSALIKRLNMGMPEGVSYYFMLEDPSVTIRVGMRCAIHKIKLGVLYISH